MSLHPNAGKMPAPESLIDPSELVTAFFTLQPDPAKPAQKVSFGTSGHRGSSLSKAFNEAHLLAVAQAVADHRKEQGITGPLYLGLDSHALSYPAFATVLRVLIANAVNVRFEDRQLTPTPAVSHAILAHGGNADGLILTPSHNPPEDGGIKYNPPDGGPADTQVTKVIQSRANSYLEAGLDGVRMLSFERAISSPHAERFDFMADYVQRLGEVVDMAAIKDAGLRLGVHPMGGAAIDYWRAIAQHWGLDVTLVEERVDSRFGFIPCDHDGKIRMDCSSPHAMASLIAVKDDFDLALGNDTDGDRHGIVTPDAGLLNCNRYLAVVVDYLLKHRPTLPETLGVGTTVVTSAQVGRVARAAGRHFMETPVGVKWFVDGLYNGKLIFGGEESAGGTFVTRDGKPWSTDKDGIIMCLLAAEILAVTGMTPSRYYKDIIEAQFGPTWYQRIDAPITDELKAGFARLGSEVAKGALLAGEPVVDAFTQAPGNNAAIGGLKVVTEHGWFAARPSGTEPIYKIYAESFKSQGHLDAIIKDAQALLAQWLAEA
ncbi:phosphoglucomutase, alpha-D-glucose phosphate-specific [Gallaecimonas kandeliae]|uniref:phosphoglucomutase, alpha-D-glucose phosphate-specific n=1 Tax=Gallaecimonas kandeliae TaxID=3029055 RepID=UPI00264A46A7|nr:phosphoglucomutase, alpha-D-glucose phosphate-specific [Gallaecimonas kandeliae]WKE67197.1 phosphoglucomutase, alpha-D-glucose phosphate-specific [Gallaecimonas kandeliae]